ncbi:MAG: M20 family metallopeptidase [Actinobacteria bacterium]|nr:M20 family metallopeptidase [Actinomycetota bacterium]
MELTQALIRVPSAPGDQGGQRRAAELVAEFLASKGFDIELQPVRRTEANLVARLRGSTPGPTLVFSGHLDTVPIGPTPWSRDPLGASIEDGFIHGRGAADMKAGVAAMAVAVAGAAGGETSLAGDLVLALTADEEVDSAGARVLVESGLVDDATMLVVGEPTGLDVGCAHRGLLWLRVTTNGSRGHGAIVQREQNAISRMVDALAPFEEFEEMLSGSDRQLGRGSIAVTQLEGGDAPNVVPASASATLDVRILPKHDRHYLRQEIGARFDGLETIREGAPVVTPTSHELIRATEAIVATAHGRAPEVRDVPYLTDASVFTEGRVLPTVFFGPGDESQAHVVDEKVPIAHIHEARSVYLAMIQRLLRGADVAT